MQVDIRYAVFIEPESDLKELLLEWKDRVAGLWPKARYLFHPPHCTVWVGKLEDGESALKAVGLAIEKLAKFSITIHGPRVFYNDVLAGGGHTCALEAIVSRSMKRLQGDVCESLRQYRPSQLADELPADLRHNPFLKSWHHYGFPFVGTHWIPHFTIASLPTRKSDPIITEFLAVHPPTNMMVNSVSWWRVAGDEHERVARFHLGGAS